MPKTKKHTQQFLSSLNRCGLERVKKCIEIAFFEVKWSNTPQTLLKDDSRKNVFLSTVFDVVLENPITLLPQH